MFYIPGIVRRATVQIKVRQTVTANFPRGRASLVKRKTNYGYGKLTATRANYNRVERQTANKTSTKRERVSAAILNAETMFNTPFCIISRFHRMPPTPRSIKTWYSCTFGVLLCKQTANLCAISYFVECRLKE